MSTKSGTVTSSKLSTAAPSALLLTNQSQANPLNSPPALYSLISYPILVSTLEQAIHISKLDENNPHLIILRVLAIAFWSFSYSINESSNLELANTSVYQSTNLLKSPPFIPLTAIWIKYFILLESKPAAYLGLILSALAKLMSMNSKVVWVSAVSLL